MGIGFLKVLGKLGQCTKFASFTNLRQWSDSDCSSIEIANEKDDGFDLGRMFFLTILKIEFV